MIEMSVDTAKITKLQTKFEKYGPYALGEGLKAANDYLNSSEVKNSLYPPVPKGAFVWSSDKQRKAYFATNGFGAGIPYTRTMQLALQGKFVIDMNSFWIEYSNALPYAKWVIHPSHQIIGHKTNKWQVMNTFITKQSTKIVPKFKTAVLDAWERMDSFMYGGGAGL